MEPPQGAYRDRVLISGHAYTLVRLVNPAPGVRAANGQTKCPVAICRDDDGGEFYVPEKVWREAMESSDGGPGERPAQTDTAAGTATDMVAVTAKSPADAKFELFFSLFRGRADVHAHGYRRKDGGIGYTPACANEWRRGACPKAADPKARCAGCESRRFLPLDRAVLSAHFRGGDERLRDVVGLYVMNEDCTTSVLVMDFDDDGWTDAVAAVRQAAREHGIEPSVERSRSGNGGHVWFFFEQPIEARLAREFGSVLITEATGLAKGVGFDAYDRMLPAQTTIPDGGFGNLVALPLQGAAMRRGNSMFVDEGLLPHPDQWAYLSGVRRLTECEVRAVVAAGGTAGALGALASANSVGGESKDAGGAEERRPQTAETGRRPLTRADFGDGELEIVRGGMLLVPTGHLSAAAANRVRRLAAFANPDFYRAQAMHQSVHGKPRVVDLGEPCEGGVALPRGCEEGLVALLDAAGAPYRMEDRRFDASRTVDVSFRGELRPDQEEAVGAMLSHEDGILCAPTGYGKTVVAAAIIGRLGLPALVIVPNTSLVDQWVEKLEEFLDVPQEPEPLLTPSGRQSRRRRPKIGRLGGGRNRLGGIVDVATFQSLTERDPDTGEPRAKGLLAGYGVVVCDECHHAGAPQLELVLKASPARRVYGLSATPRRSDGLDAAIAMLCGPVRHRVDIREHALRQGFERLLTPRITCVRLPGLEPGATFNQVLDQLCAHEARNALIVTDVSAALERGRFPLVLSRRREHAAGLARMLEERVGSRFEVHLLMGGGNARERRAALDEVLESADGSRPFAIVATAGYLGEGFDASWLDALFLATPVSWDGVVTQQAGRLHRTREGKTDVVVFDYVDATVPMLERMYKRRLKTYRKMGYEVAASDEGDHGRRGPSAFVSASDAMALLREDMASACRSVRIAAPYAAGTCCAALAPAFRDARARGLTVEVRIAKDPGAEALGTLGTTGATASVDEGTPVSGLAVFDDATVWYGTLPLLAFPRKDDCSVRFRSAEAAHELVETAFGETGTTRLAGRSGDGGGEDM